VCRQRDPKGLYARADRGEIPQFTGLDSPYEARQHAEVHLRADELNVSESVNLLLAWLADNGVLKAGYRPVAA